MKFRIISLVLVCTMLFTLSVPASASTLSDPCDTTITCTNTNSSSEIQTRSFVREYSLKLTNSNYTKVMSDSNWWGETTVTVGLVASDGANSVQVYVVDSDGRASAVKRCYYEGYAAAFSIPAGSFTVYAKLSAYSYGNVTLSVSLA